MSILFFDPSERPASLAGGGPQASRETRGALDRLTSLSQQLFDAEAVIALDDALGIDLNIDLDIAPDASQQRAALATPTQAFVELLAREVREGPLLVLDSLTLGGLSNAAAVSSATLGPKGGVNAAAAAAYVRFYAALPLTASDGTHLGALCLLGPTPKKGFGKPQLAALSDVAALAVGELEHALTRRALARSERLVGRAHSALADKMVRLKRTTLRLHQVNGRLQQRVACDPLTGLPNRAQLTGKLRQAIAQPDLSFALLFVDLDRFAIINDSFGYAVGDEVLAQVAARLSQDQPESVVARFGSDEFCVLLYNVTQKEAVGAAQRVQRHFDQPFSLGEHTLRLSVSVGVVPSAFFYLRADDMLQDAAIATRHAKHAGRARVQLFNARLREARVQRFNLEEALRNALKQQQLEVFYQPIFYYPTPAAARLTGFEALVRWRSASGTFISPADFIPVAEESGLIAQLDRWVLAEACRQVALWQRTFGLPQLGIGVNLSSHQFRGAHADFAGEKLVSEIEKQLKESALAPDRLHLEITESTLLHASDQVEAVLTRLKTLGVRLSLDDFGTGYSSLSYLHRFPFDILKIDRSFIQNMTHSAKSSELVRTIVTMAQNLGLGVVAEGVETEAHREQLSAFGCPYMQGYLFSKPLSRSQATAFLQQTVSRTHSVLT